MDCMRTAAHGYLLPIFFHCRISQNYLLLFVSSYKKKCSEIMRLIPNCINGHGARSEPGVVV